MDLEPDAMGVGQYNQMLEILRSKVQERPLRWNPTVSPTTLKWRPATADAAAAKNATVKGAQAS